MTTARALYAALVAWFVGRNAGRPYTQKYARVEKRTIK
jgi:hypothetical protein